MLIKSVARKEKQFIKNIKIKIIEEHINLLNSFNKFWKKNSDGTSRHSTDWIYYFSNTMKSTADIDLHSLSPKT